ncbi:FxsA family protein [Dermatophilaceae bacterium Sec6.4]
MTSGPIPAGTPVGRRRHWVRWVVLLLFLVLPVCEIALVVAIGQAIGGWKTFGLLLIWSVIGVWLVKRTWGSAWRDLREAGRNGQMPTDDLLDAVLALLGGVLILIPGFITDFFGLLLILPFTRPIGRTLIKGWAARRVAAGVGGVTIVQGQRVPPTYTAYPYSAPTDTHPQTPMAPGAPGAIEGKIVREKHPRE